MRITPTIPNHVARAYGVPTPRPAAPVTPTTAPRPLGSPAQTTRTEPTRKVSAPRLSEPQVTEQLSKLIAGRVSRSVDFHDVSTPEAPRGAADTYQMYTRAADKFEAAVRVGQNLDLHG